MPAVLFRSDNDSPEEWRAALAKRIPDLDFRVWPEVGDPGDIGFALVWKLPAGALAGLPNLKAVCSLGQGVDHLFADPDFPRGPRILRIVDPWMGQAMAEWVLLQVLRFHRQGPDYERFQRERRWIKLPAPQTATRRVGILGLGALGAEAATTIAGPRFRCRGVVAHRQRHPQRHQLRRSRSAPRLPGPHRHLVLPASADAGDNRSDQR